ncbi:MAG: TIGR02466 family protein [Gammaproteobacteria bacterium]|jgi:uncharacterized protein (TIGR02466 family)
METKDSNLFITPVQMTDLELNIDSLIEFCYITKLKTGRGVEYSNMGGWQSDNVIYESHPEFVKLKNKIIEAANIYHNKIGLKKNLKEEISNIWININGKGHFNELHNHPKSIMSGAFYLRGKAPILFRHPFHYINQFFWEEAIIEEWTKVNSTVWTIDPNPNLLIIFPAWVEHRVLMNDEETDRISISFNTVLTGD